MQWGPQVKDSDLQDPAQDTIRLMQAMILAAGLGTRLRPYTLVRPKPLFPVLNRPLLHILIDMLRDVGCAHIVVNGHHLSRLIMEAVRCLPDVAFQDEPEILGTGGGIRKALAGFSAEPVLVMNGDIFHTVNLAQLYRHHINSGNIITMALHDYPRFRSVSVSGDRIVSFRPAEHMPKNSLLTFTGIHVVEPEVIRQIPAGRFHNIIDLYENLAKRGERVGFVRVDDCFWRDIGTPDDYLRLHKELLTGSVEQKSVLPAVSGQWLVDRQAQVAGDAVLSGWGCIGKAAIGSGVSLHNCVVWDNAVVPEGICRKNCIIPGQEV